VTGDRENAKLAVGSTWPDSGKMGCLADFPSHPLVRGIEDAKLRARLISQNLLNYDGLQVPVIVIMTSDSHTYVPHNLKGLLSSE
jgi:hypothetical protein